MDFLDALHLKAARERAWLVGDPAWMCQWLIDQARRSSTRATEFKVGYAARCREMAARFRAAPERHALDPNEHWRWQPRIPKHNEGGGQWTRLAGDVPTPDPDKSSDIPKRPLPTTRQRNRLAKELARHANRTGETEAAFAIVKGVDWLQDQYASFVSYFDGPKSLDELQDNAQLQLDRILSAKGYDVHHIVEQTQAEKDGYPRSKIDGPDNLVRIPRWKHHEISGWFQTANDDYEGLPPREYLKGKSWKTRTRVGLDALRKFGVLTP